MSDYYNKIVTTDPEVATRYVQKLGIINNLDPFALDDKDLTRDPTKFPSVTNMDIITYLVLTTSYYTKEQMKAYKSLNAFKYFDAGFVSGCGAHQIGDYIVVVGKVKHSQRMNLPPLHVWVVCQTDGSVCTAHCTCMAGLGEVCSHVGAVLYSIEYIVSTQNNTSCTDVRAMWKVPGVTKVEYKMVKEMEFGRVIPSSTRNINPLTAEEITKLLMDIDEAGSSAALMRVVEPFASQIGDEIKNRDIERETPNPYRLLYNEEYESYTLEDLVFVGDSTQIMMTQEECAKIRESTTKQSKSQEWHLHRIGRITASNFKQSVKTSISKPSLTLIKSICYPMQHRFRAKATEWGKNKEKIALEAYKTEQDACHEKLHLEPVGLCIKPEIPCFGASPDSMVSCECCGRGCVEIKCPYYLKEKNIEEFAKLRDSCLVIINEGDICLNEKHSYFYQTQQQMAITNTLYCDFVVWSPRELFIQRIPFNEDFWALESQKSLAFHKYVIMPELLGKYFTICNTFAEKKYCICQTIDDGRPMIKCENDTCTILWYHKDCISMTEIPENLWYCPNCREEA